MGRCGGPSYARTAKGTAIRTCAESKRKKMKAEWDKLPDDAVAHIVALAQVEALPILVRLDKRSNEASAERLAERLLCVWID